MIEDLAQFLEDNNIGTVGTDIFIGEMAVDVGDCMSIRYAPSPPPDKAIPEFEQTIDFWCRDAQPALAYQKLLNVRDLLHRAPDDQNYTMGSFHVYNSFALGSIDDMDRDIDRRKLYKLSIIFRYAVK